MLVLAQAPAHSSIEEVLDSLETGTSDEEIAHSLETAGPEALPEPALRWLERAGAGPDTRRALRKLQQRSASLAPVGRQIISEDPRPSAQEVAAILERAKAYVRRYTSTLVDFTCSEISQESTRRVIASRPFPDTSVIVTSVSKWDHKKSRQRQIAYFRGREYDSGDGESNFKPGAAWSDGEFANTLNVTFANLTDSQVNWDHWEFQDGKKMAVFGYSLDPAHTKLAVSTQVFRAGAWQPVALYVPYSGFFFVGVEDGTIDRLVVNTTSLPTEYAMQCAKSVLDYGPVQIGGKTFLLLTRSTSYIRTKESDSLFRKTFADYRHFEADSRFVMPNK